MLDDSLRHPADGVAGADPVTRRGGRGELPHPLTVESAQIDAALQEEAGLLRQQIERILKAVVHLGEQPGTEFDAQEFAGELDLVAHLEAVGALEDLQIGAVAAHPDDFALEFCIADRGERDFILHDLVGKFDGHQVAVDSDNLLSGLELCHCIETPARKKKFVVLLPRGGRGR